MLDISSVTFGRSGGWTHGVSSYDLSNHWIRSLRLCNDYDIGILCAGSARGSYEVIEDLTCCKVGREPLPQLISRSFSPLTIPLPPSSHKPAHRSSAASLIQTSVTALTLIPHTFQHANLTVPSSFFSYTNSVGNTVLIGKSACSGLTGSLGALSFFAAGAFLAGTEEEEERSASESEVGWDLRLGAMLWNEEKVGWGTRRVESRGRSRRRVGRRRDRIVSVWWEEKRERAGIDDGGLLAIRLSAG